ncbi:MAG: DUF401 family protein [Thermodesulfobacteriota bacterium]
MLFLASMPALIKVLLALALILTLNRLKLHLGLSLFVGAVTLGLMMGLSPVKIGQGLVKSLTDSQSLSLIVIVTVILVLSRLMADIGQLDRMVESFSGLVHNVKVSSLVMPALIGLLPMPGGALFSAPMVEAAFRGEKVSPEVKTVINYWFRHIWEYVWPLYPGYVLAVSLLGVPNWKFTLLQTPMTLIATAAGMLFLWPILPGAENESGGAGGRGRWQDFSRQVQPIALIVLAIPAVKLIELASGLTLPGLTSVYLGLGLCLGWVIVQNRLKPRAVFSALFHKAVFPMVVLVLGIMAFKGLLVESRAVEQIQKEMAFWGIPPLLAVALMPFLSGMVTGIAVGFVGASFPLIVPLFPPGHGLDFMAYATLAFGFGYMGMMLSPVHLCLIVTKDYFSASLLKSYRHLVGPAVIVLLAQLGLFSLFRMIG